jgi:hypothetical protein
MHGRFMRNRIAIIKYVGVLHLDEPIFLCVLYAMLPMAHIRQNIFGLSQSAFAEIAGVRQPTVSRWENGEFEPNRDELQRIREAAQNRGLPWNDSWFFDQPESQEAQAS